MCPSDSVEKVSGAHCIIQETLKCYPLLQCLAHNIKGLDPQYYGLLDKVRAKKGSIIIKVLGSAALPINKINLANSFLCKEQNENFPESKKTLLIFHCFV